EIEIPVFHGGRVDPVLEDPFFAPYSVLGVAHVHGVGGTPGLENLRARHSGDYALALDVLLKGRVEQTRQEPPPEHEEQDQRQEGIDAQPDWTAAQERLGLRLCWLLRFFRTPGWLIVVSHGLRGHNGVVVM